MKKLLVTGSSGLIGSEVVRHFDALGYKVYGVDNNMRADFFGPKGDTRWNESQRYKYSDKNREGDHICYISDLSKTKTHYANWDIIKPLKLFLKRL